jgi:hypothetical protein
MTTSEKPKTLPHEGTVTAISQREGVPTGLKLDGGEWLNYTQPQWRDAWYEPQKGERIRVHVADGKWIRSIERLGGQQSFEDGQVPAGGRELSIMRQTCLKVAGEQIAARAHEYKDTEDGPATNLISIDTLALAQDYERWVTRDNVSFE